MRAHFLQHVPFEGLGSIEPWLAARGAELTVTRLFAGELPPSVDGLDLVVAGGGPMSVNDEATLPWLVAEKAFLRRAMDESAAVLGLCLGAQLISSALGSRVYPATTKEIGWFPVQAVAAPDSHFTVPAQFTPFHWHGETFDLPEGAVLLASTSVCQNQAFQLGPRIIGLQFHLEATAEGVASLIEHSRDEMTPGPFVQSEAEMRDVTSTTYAAANAVMDGLLEYLVPSKGPTRLRSGTCLA